MLIEGPIQYDAAVDPTVAAAKAPGSPAGKPPSASRQPRGRKVPVWRPSAPDAL
ncbi:hypothetical protein AB0M28_36710 [Streptomyces sp. NPDC051940]|uniref:hypothetical protein n=1 Tax=Streptomyces sp. NPDC051940 TaxID=3155675 RepID=UPI003438C17F